MEYVGFRPPKMPTKYEGSSEDTHYFTHKNIDYFMDYIFLFFIVHFRPNHEVNKAAS